MIIDDNTIYHNAHYIVIMMIIITLCHNQLNITDKKTCTTI